jgi:tRNA nucleotidyltransferase (CCA-adding enzyme)
MRHVPIPRTVRRFAGVFHSAGYRLYIVGGAVRNFYAGLPIKDYDFATDADPHAVTTLFRRTVPTGIEHGTVTVIYSGESFEVTTFRTEAGYSDSRHPDAVRFTGSLEEDLARRDFTVNALAVDTATGELTDLFHGMEDLRRGIIRAIGSPQERFQEDSLRMLRAFRFSALLSFTIEERTLEAVRMLSGKIAGVSAERVQEELNGILAVPAPSKTLIQMHRAGLLKEILPELADCTGTGSKGPNEIDTFTHLCLSCDGAPRDNPAVRWAALLHDIGKPETENRDEAGLISYHGHDSLSADMADRILRRLKFSNQFRTRCVHLIRMHMFSYTPEWSDAAVRRFINRVGETYIDDLMLLKRADFYGSCGVPLKSGSLLDELSARVQQQISSSEALTLSDLAVNGHMLINAGIPQGPAVGTLLNLLLEAVLEDPKLNSTDTLLEMARRMSVRHHLL